jgi:hypothetical protein
MHKIEEEIILMMMIEIVIIKIKETIDMMIMKTVISIVIIIMMIEIIAMVVEKMTEAADLEITTIKVIQEDVIVVNAEAVIITEDIEECLKSIIIHQDVQVSMLGIKKNQLNKKLR